jgi:hypothetical protein
MNPWHLDRGLLQRYEAGCADLPLAGSIEAHLNSCTACRRLADSVVPAERLARIWQNVEAGIDAPQPTILRRILTRLRLASLGLALVRAVANHPRPSLRALGAMASAVLFLVVPIWVVGSSTTSASRPRPTETAMVNPPSGPAWPLSDPESLDLPSEASRSLEPHSAAGLSTVVWSLATGVLHRRVD